MAMSRFAQPVSDADEIQVRASTLPGNTKASTDCGIRVSSEWAASRVTADVHHEGVVPVTTAGDPLRKKDGKEYPPKSLYTLVCRFKRYYEQTGVFNDPLSSSDSSLVTLE